MAIELLNRGANPNEKAHNGSTPLHLVMDKRKVRLNLVRSLLQNGADPEAKDDNNCNPLLDALHFQASNKIIDFLLKNGADVFVVTGEGRLTALHIVAQNDNTSVMKQLIEKGLAVDAQDKYGWTSLHEAAYRGHMKAAEVLIKNGKSL